MKRRTVLITGTTTGIGKELLKQYLELGDFVIAVNRRTVLENFDPVLMEHVKINITDINEVTAQLQALEKKGLKPDLLILNAGINRIDNMQTFDPETFQEVWNINYLGVSNFVAAIQRLGWTHRKIIAISSTSNIIPNPAHIGYYLSKLALAKSFPLFQQRDRSNTYKVVILGPVHTEIMADYLAPSGLNGWIFDSLAISAEQAADRCMRFASDHRPVLRYPFPSILFYLAARFALFFLPGIYRGTGPDQCKSQQNI